eukprot:gnl/TRDRNA2_/TRDRNA2_202792_c0_seq1.p1 gnl/TRDRNA2_/TRDRNA2_202792_c0~~gnl/TRDRNA2_/TRDRNA2_202792_c0_seq1.p1  ORF type:complete len:239 (+),score=41.79 gnl/TRDRNA2_/TRDRNA2_202792_c0_seq1:169-885(+)
MAITSLEDAVESLSGSTVTTLDFSKNKIGTPGAERIAVPLKDNTSLTTLNLSRNNIRDKGAESIAAALEHNSSVQTLDLSWNGISGPGAERIAAALELNKSVTTLNLSWNRISAHGANLIAAALEFNNTVTTLDVSGNETGHRNYGAQQIAEAVERNKSGCLVLTVSCEKQETKHCAISCTNMAGSQVALVLIEPEQSIGRLKEQIVVQLPHRGHLRLICADGTWLNDSKATVGGCLL